MNDLSVEPSPDGASPPSIDESAQLKVEARAFPNALKRFDESTADRWVWGLLAGLLVLGFAYLISVYWSPAHPGVDQNGYLVGGKLLAKTGSSGFFPENPYAFVGRMWVESPNGKMFPKYPLGLSAIYAICLKLAGPKLGAWLSFAVSPAAMTLAMAATFMFVRTVAGSFAGLLALLIVGTSPVTLGLADNPNSHATALCLVTWGMYFSLRWWQSNGLWRAVLAGLLIGLAVTIRYTEGLVALPMGLIALMNLRPRERRSWVHVLSMMLAWALPVAALVIYNWVSFHHLTGYDPTNESTGFTWDSFKVNWDTMLRELYNTGLFFVLPFSLMGLVLMWRWNARLTLVLTAWVVPNLALYTAYYWAPDNASIGYLRFFLTIFPALALAAAWTIMWFLELATSFGERVMPVIAFGAVIALACGFDLYNGLAITESDARTNVGVAAGMREVTTVCPPGSTIFSSDQLLDALQFAGDYHLYETQQFNRQSVQRFALVDPNVPALLQAQRAKEMYDRLKDATDYELIAEQNKLMRDALAAHERVYVILPASQLSLMNRFLPRRSFSSIPVGGWSAPVDQRSFQRLQRGQAGGFGGRPRGNPAGGFGRRIVVDPTSDELPWTIMEVKAVPTTSAARPRH